MEKSGVFEGPFALVTRDVYLGPDCRRWRRSFAALNFLSAAMSFGDMPVTERNLTRPFPASYRQSIHSLWPAPRTISAMR